MTGDPDRSSFAGSPPIPGDSDATFETPWQARAFAVTVALREQAAFEAFDFEAFQRRLASGIDSDETARWGETTERQYYQHWLRALEQLLIEGGTISETELHDRAREFQTEARDASEFVEGDRDSDHGHSHPH
jgi:nitrile hydratase accessory protein